MPMPKANQMPEDPSLVSKDLAPGICTDILEDVELHRPEQCPPLEHLPDGPHCCSCHGPLGEDAIVCIRAGGKHNPKDTKRCRKCHALRSRIDRLILNSSKLAQGCYDLNDEERRALMQKGHSLYGDNLNGLLIETVCNSTAHKTSEAFTRDGDFVDAEEMADRYKDRPAQLDWGWGRG